MNKEWSDDEENDEVDNEELIQPSRDFPPSDEDNEEGEEEYDYDMYELTKLTMNKTSDDLFITDSVKNKQTIDINNDTKKEVKIHKVVNSIWDKEVKKSTIRKFNPRLPPPNKYNKHNKNNFNLNINDFPSL